MLLEAFEFAMNFCKLMVQTVCRELLVQNMRFGNELYSQAVILMEYNFDWSKSAHTWSNIYMGRPQIWWTQALLACTQKGARVCIVHWRGARLSLFCVNANRFLGSLSLVGVVPKPWWIACENKFPWSCILAMIASVSMFASYKVNKMCFMVSWTSFMNKVLSNSGGYILTGWWAYSAMYVCIKFKMCNALSSINSIGRFHQGMQLELRLSSHHNF